MKLPGLTAKNSVIRAFGIYPQRSPERDPRPLRTSSTRLMENECVEMQVASTSTSTTTSLREYYFYHVSDSKNTKALLKVNKKGYGNIKATGKGEFGEGFYTWGDEGVAKVAAPYFASKEKWSGWVIIRFTVPYSVLAEGDLFYGEDGALFKQHYINTWFEDVDYKGSLPVISKTSSYDEGTSPDTLFFDDTEEEVTVTYPGETEKSTYETTWGSFIKTEESTFDWGYDMIIGPHKDKLGFKGNPPQYMFGKAVSVLNDPKVTRETFLESE